MINLKKACLLATVGVMLAPAAVFAGDHAKDVVKNTHGNLVKNTFGNCVITKWDAEADQCKHQLVLTKEQRTVYFDFNRSTLNSKEKAKLNAVSNIIKRSKSVASVDVVGYADMIGDSSYNKRLSTRRARTVKSFLASKGLRTRNVRVSGKGESGSVTSCDNNMERKALIACLAEDRRVEIFLNYVK